LEIFFWGFIPNRTEIAVRNRFRQIQKVKVKSEKANFDFFDFRFDGLDADFIFFFENRKSEFYESCV
jgi:hypothetical protein